MQGYGGPKLPIRLRGDEVCPWVTMEDLNILRVRFRGLCKLVLEGTLPVNID